MMLRCFFPELLGNVNNYIPANPIKTPLHIQPEWYFLFAYTILRSIPHKRGGVLALLCSILVLLLFPVLHRGKMRRLSFYPVHQCMFWSLVCRWLGLT